MSIASMTVADFAAGCWSYLWRAVIWTLIVMFFAFALKVEISWNVLLLCIISNFFDSVIGKPRVTPDKQKSVNVKLKDWN